MAFVNAAEPTRPVGRYSLAVAAVAQLRRTGEHGDLTPDTGGRDAPVCEASGRLAWSGALPSCPAIQRPWRHPLPGLQARQAVGRLPGSQEERQ